MIKIDKIVYSNRHSIQIQITSVGELVIRAPKKASESAIMRFVMQKQSWIELHQQNIKAKNQLNAEIIAQNSILFFGKSYKITKSNIKTISFDDNTKCCLIPLQINDVSVYIKKIYKKMAIKYLHSRVEHFINIMHNKPDKLRLTNAQTCWGSCNSNKVVSLNWRLLMVALDEIDYVVVHELSHLTQMNHSKLFWAIVAQYIQNYKYIKTKLKKHDYLLNLYR